MFMSQSQPHHGRSYGAPSTARRRGDKENAGALPSKTPSRNALKQVGGPSTGRMLGKTMTIDRNVLAPKSDAPPPTDDIKPKRLFANAQPPPSAKGPVKPRSVKTPGHAKTPAPYRDLEPEPQPTPLPSAQRTRRRSRNSLVRTPEHLWDQEISLDSIAEVELEPETPPVESDYELEYAPSPVKDVPYVPEWADSIPDPIETMTKLGNMRPMLFVRAPSPPKALQSVPMPTLELCSDNEIEEPALRKAKPAVVAAPRLEAASTTTKTTSRTLGIRGPGGATRPGASTTRPAARAAPGAARLTTTRPAAAASAAGPTSAKSATGRPAVVAKAGSTTGRVARAAPMGAARSIAAPRPANGTRPTASSFEPGVRGVAPKTETRPTATRAAAASTVRKPVSSTQPSKTFARLGVKPSTAARPAVLTSKATGRPALARATARPVTPPAPSSPTPEFADMDLNFGVLDLDFDELEPKVEVPTVDLGPEEVFNDPPPLAVGPEVVPVSVEAASLSTDLPEPAAKPDTPPNVAEPIAADAEFDENDFEAVDPALAPPVPSSTLAFDPIPEETEHDVSEDMSLESI